MFGSFFLVEPTFRYSIFIDLMILLCIRNIEVTDDRIRKYVAFKTRFPNLVMQFKNLCY